MVKRQTVFTLPIVRVLLAGILMAWLTGCGHKTLIVSTNALAPTPAGTTTSAPDWPERRNAPQLAKQQKSDGTANIPVDGIPFYVKRGSCKKETVWVEPQYTVTLTITLDDKGPEILEEGTLTRRGFLNPNTKLLVNFLSGIQGRHELSDKFLAACPQNVKDHWDTVFPPSGPVDAPPILQYEVKPHVESNLTASQPTTQTSPVVEAEAAGNLIRVINAASVVPAVDYSHVYYMNGKTPWIGSSQVETKLAEDGTLSEASGQAEDDTWSTVLSTITGLVGDFTGASTAASAATAPAAPAPVENAEILNHESIGSHGQPNSEKECAINPPDWPKPKHSVTYTYKITTTVYTHDHTRQTFDLANGCSPEGDGVTDGNFTITKVGSDGGSDAKKNAITVSGTITVPDTKEAKVKGKTGGSK